MQRLEAQDRGGFGDNLKLVGNPYDEIRIGTQHDGSFVNPNVPVPVAWYVYAKMESITTLGASDPFPTSSAHDGELLNIGDIQIIPGHQLRGKVTLSDGARIPVGMRITIASDRVRDDQTVPLAPDGRFEFRNLPTGKYNVFPSVRGYKRHMVEITIDKDVDGFYMVLEPDKKSG